MTHHHLNLGPTDLQISRSLFASCFVTDSDTKPAVRDCIIKIDKAILNASRDPDGRAQKLSNSNVPITYFDLPTRGSIMHRIIAPGTERSKLDNVWFTELGSDRVGTVKLSKKRNLGDYQVLAEAQGDYQVLQEAQSLKASPRSQI